MELTNKILEGDVRTAGRLMRDIETIESPLKDYIHQHIDKGDYLETLIDDLVQRKTSPHSAALQIINRFSE